jgi:HAD superfamily hydrolase (TIGR01509 family)
MLDSVLFELDGVLVDTADARRDALLATLGADGLSLSESEYRETCAGLAIDEAVRAALRLRQAATDETVVDLTVHRVDRTYRAFLGKGLSLVEGAREVVERLQAIARLALVTRASRSEVELVLSLGRLEDAFSCVVAAEDTPRGKPAPDGYRVALARLARQRPVAPNAQTIALEDGLPGIRAARAAGVRCIAVGPLPAHVVLEADACLPSITGLSAERLLALIGASNERIS